MSNLKIYDAVRKVPQEAKKAITGGRLKGMTDINPMWRIKVLTELFGPCGVGWYPEITKQWIEEGAKDEKTAHVNINIYVKHEGEWSKPIQGTGGAMLVENESRGPHTSDECFKMAYTDAISVACKLLGVGADVYWEKDKTKYDKPEQDSPKADPPKKNTITKAQADELNQLIADTGTDMDKLLEYYHVQTLNEMTPNVYAQAMSQLKKKNEKHPQK